MDFKPQAFLFDLNGTMIDDMHFHTQAWYDIINKDLGKALSWEDVKIQMYGKNEEVLERIFGNGHFTLEQAEKISIEKEEKYQSAFRPELKLLHGLEDFLIKSKNYNMKMAIASAAIPFNIDFVLDNLDIRHYFQAVVSAADVKMSKPHPETFLKAAEQLNVDPANCIVFEDAPKGVEAAQNAGMVCIVLKTVHEEIEFEKYDNILGYVHDFSDPFLNDLFKKVVLEG